MPSSRTATVRDLRRTNRSRALWELYLHGPCTRQDIGAATGASAGTISNVIGELIDQGVVVEIGLEESTGGRPRGVLRIDPEYGFVIGVDIAETAFLVELFDLGMGVRASHRSTTELTGLEPEDAILHILDGIDAVIAAADVSQDEVLGVGVGVPGVVEHGTTAVVYGQTVGWDAVPFERLMRRRTSLPLIIDNGAKTLGQAETWFGAARHVDNAVIALLGIGVGTSIVSDRRLYRGATSSAGEWGHTVVEVGGRTCRCGARGCLEAYVGAAGLVARYGELTGQPDAVDQHDLERRVATIIAAAQTDPFAAQVLDETSTYLGAGIANLVNLFNPERVVVGGWLGRALGERLPGIREATARNALRLPFSHVQIVRGELGADAVALGAATLPIAQFLSSGGFPLERSTHGRRIRNPRRLSRIDSQTGRRVATS